MLGPQDLFLTLLFAGHDTSAATITRLFSELPRHPDVWNRIIAEQQQVSICLSILAMAGLNSEVQATLLRTFTHCIA